MWATPKIHLVRNDDEPYVGTFVFFPNSLQNPVCVEVNYAMDTLVPVPNVTRVQQFPFLYLKLEERVAEWHVEDSFEARKWRA
jgi:hypothetical protein